MEVQTKIAQIELDLHSTPEHHAQEHIAGCQGCLPCHRLPGQEVPHYGLPIIAGRHGKAGLYRVALQHMCPAGVAAQPLQELPCVCVPDGNCLI